MLALETPGQLYCPSTILEICLQARLDNHWSPDHQDLLLLLERALVAAG